jgi:hypothetical protein
MHISSARRNTLINFSGIFIFLLLFSAKCNRGYVAIQKEKASKTAIETRTKNLLKSIKGIKFTEVRRQFDNGLSFSPVGYQLVPEWRISFPSVDSVNIYSPRKGRFLNAPVVFDHDSIFNVAWAWLRLKYIKKDSMQFQVLHVTDKTIDDEKVHVFMTFYTNDYIKNVLHKDSSNVSHPSRNDTLYIKAKVLLANKILDSAFAGTEPVTLKAKSPLISIVKETVQLDDVNGGKSYDEYLLPTFDITIHKAYEDFNYLFSVYVDENGKLIFRKPNQFEYPEFKEAAISTMKGITDGYLKLYMSVKPGKTLGMPHSSIILLNVTGTKQ